jgi:hypothetical protein
MGLSVVALYKGILNMCNKIHNNELHYFSSTFLKKFLGEEQVLHFINTIICIDYKTDII